MPLRAVLSELPPRPDLPESAVVDIGDSVRVPVHSRCVGVAPLPTAPSNSMGVSILPLTSNLPLESSSSLTWADGRPAFNEPCGCKVDNDTTLAMSPSPPLCCGDVTVDCQPSADLGRFESAPDKMANVSDGNDRTVGLSPMTEGADCLRLNSGFREVLYHHNHTCTVLLGLACLVGLHARSLLQTLSGLMPAILQPAMVHEGFGVRFGTLVAYRDLLDSVATAHSVSPGVLKWHVVGVTIDNLRELVQISSLDANFSMEPLKNWNYTETANFAREINSAVLATGACYESGGAAGDARWRCRDYPHPTMHGMKQWNSRLEEACKVSRASIFTLERIFHKCLRFNDHNPGSAYIVSGEVTYLMGLACTWTEMELLPWEGNYGAMDVKEFDMQIMQSHRLECTSKVNTSLSHGFIGRVTRNVTQVWPLSRERLPSLVRCATDFPQEGPTEMQKHRRWTGNVAIGSVQLATWCHDRHLGDRPQACWDAVFSNLREDSPLAQIFSNPRAYEFGSRTLTHILTDWESYSYADYSEQYHMLSESEGISPDSFRDVFGWGFGIQGAIIGAKRWDAVNEAASLTGLLPASTNHTERWRCLGPSSSDGSRKELFNTLTSGNYRLMADAIRVGFATRLPNIVAPFTVYAVALPVAWVFLHPKATSRVHALLGLGFLIYVAMKWVFDLAVSSTHADACNLRVLRLFFPRHHYVQSFSLQVIERYNVGACAVEGVQALIWLLAVVYPNQGRMPDKIAHVLLVCGLVYAIGVGAVAMESTNSCSLPWDLHEVDLVAPALVAFTAIPILIYIYRPERRDIHAVSLWQLITCDAALSDEVGLRLYGLYFKRARTVLDHSGLLQEVPDFEGHVRPDIYWIRWLKWQVLCFKGGRPQNVHAPARTWPESKQEASGHLQELDQDEIGSQAAAEEEQAANQPPPIQESTEDLPGANEDATCNTPGTNQESTQVMPGNIAALMCSCPGNPDSSDQGVHLGANLDSWTRRG